MKRKELSGYTQQECGCLLLTLSKNVLSSIICGDPTVNCLTSVQSWTETTLAGNLRLLSLFSSTYYINACCSSDTAGAERLGCSRLVLKYNNNISH